MTDRASKLRANLLDESENIIDPATEDKQDDIITKLSDGTQTTQIYDGSVGPAELDNATNTMQTIDYEHHEIHSGSHYFIDGLADLSINHVLDFTWVMPNTTKWIHWTWTLEVESETLYQVYEGAVLTNPLANTFTPLNSDRNSANTSGTVMKYEDQANLAAANTDTDVSGATLIQTGIIGTGKKSAGADNRSHEIMMKQNTIYCLRATATAAGYQNFKMQWYENTNKN